MPNHMILILVEGAFFLGTLVTALTAHIAFRAGRRVGRREQVMYHYSSKAVPGNASKRHREERANHVPSE